MPDFRAYIDGKISKHDNGACPYLSKADGGVLAGEVSIADNFIHCDNHGEPAALHILYQVDDFGQVVLKTLPLPEGDHTYNLGLELARAKLSQIEDRREAWEETGFCPSRTLREEIQRSRDVLNRADKLQSSVPARSAALAERALTRLVWAAEGLAIEAGWHGIKRRIADGSVQRMLLGANFFGFGAGNEYNRRFADLLNYATIPFYWRSFEPRPGSCQWDRMDRMLDWLAANHIMAKGHPLVWFYDPCYPLWAHRDSFEALRELNMERVKGIVSRCRGTISFWDVINEAHDADHANMFSLDHEQLVAMTDAAARTTRSANPTATTIVNVCAPFGEYAAAAPGKWTPLDYLRACIERGAEFDVIGIQYYYGSGWAYCRDMLEISEQLDRYGSLGKPVHVTEIGCPSSCKPDPYHMLGSARVEDAGEWHGKWCETLQAEWVEKFYTICCGKPFIQAITWWDFADCEEHFFTHGGLLRQDFSPKPAYDRLVELSRTLGIKQP